MKQYLDLLKDIKENGHSHPDRTGTGRRSIFGCHLRFNLEDGFPLVTTRQIFTKGFIAEMLWFIKGNSNIKELKDQNVNIWNDWAVKEEDIIEFLDKTIIIENNEDQKLYDQLKEYYRSNIDSIGPLYGYMWRHAPVKEVNINAPLIDFENLPSDKLKQYTIDYENEKLNMSFEQYCKYRYQESIDQLNELIINLKNNPYSARHIVTAWVPEIIPYERILPQENVMLGKGALAPCHAFFQCFVHPPKEGSEKKRLSLKMYQR